MKATFFFKPLEFNLNIDGETWSQGDHVKGQLNIVNHSGDSVDLSNIKVQLCFCAAKKVKVKDESGITVLESVDYASGDQVDFDFKLAQDCQITESTGSLYIICGDASDPFGGGLMQLNILPKKVITDFVEVFEQFYRFKLKNFKNKKGFIEAAVVPPSSKDWTSIQKMSLQFKMVEEDMDVTFNFAVKKMSFESIETKTKDTKLSFNHVLTPKDYSRYGSVNQDGIQKVIDEVLEQVKLKPLL